MLIKNGLKFLQTMTQHQWLSVNGQFSVLTTGWSRPSEISTEESLGTSNCKGYRLDVLYVAPSATSIALTGNQTIILVAGLA